MTKDELAVFLSIGAIRERLELGEELRKELSGEEVPITNDPEPIVEGRGVRGVSAPRPVSGKE